ncbi:MAG: hypothetical protein ACLGSD_03930 [Acidobacteriota bacterium]
MGPKGIISLALLVAVSPVMLIAQNRGGGQHRQGQQQPAAGARQGQGGGTMDRTRDRAKDQTRVQQRDRLHQQATAQQRDQYRTCDRTMTQAKTQTRTMAKAANGTTFEAGQMRDHQARVQEQLRSMQQERDRLYNGLNQDQQDAIQQRNQKLQQMHERIQNRVEEMNQELSQANPDAKRVARQARETDRAMNAYQKELRAMGDDLGLKTD